MLFLFKHTWHSKPGEKSFFFLIFKYSSGFRLQVVFELKFTNCSRRARMPSLGSLSETLWLWKEKTFFGEHKPGVETAEEQVKRATQKPGLIGTSSVVWWPFLRAEKLENKNRPSSCPPGTPVLTPLRAFLPTWKYCITCVWQELNARPAFCMRTVTGGVEGVGWEVGWEWRCVCVGGLVCMCMTPLGILRGNQSLH